MTRTPHARVLGVRCCLALVPKGLRLFEVSIGLSPAATEMLCRPKLRADLTFSDQDSLPLSGGRANELTRFLSAPPRVSEAVTRLKL